MRFREGPWLVQSQQVTKWDPHLNLSDPKAHSLYTLLLYKLNPWRTVCFFWNLQNDKNYALKDSCEESGEDSWESLGQQDQTGQS